MKRWRRCPAWAICASWSAWCATAICIRLDSPGPVLFRQKRYGYNSRLVEAYKFCSMYADKTDHDPALISTEAAY
ncbi:sugar transferase [Chromobacterium violaceum]|uniref:sugar transferase n=1 Tax=Chromobacterium violaceum TaxID=536 RepID=UPI001E3BFA98|nr:sugar transferase [Chromobacterium violaceum]